MTSKLEKLVATLTSVLGESASVSAALGEVTVVLKAADYYAQMQKLRDDPSLKFEQLLDLCGVDYSTYGEGTWDGLRFAAVSHLLSLEHNWRVRVRVFATADEMPVLASVVALWRSANWYEREAFDLYGILQLQNKIKRTNTIAR